MGTETVSTRQFLVLGCPYVMGKFFYFQNKLRHDLRHMRVHAARIFGDFAQGKWCPKFQKYLMLLAYNSTLLCLLTFA